MLLKTNIKESILKKPCLLTVLLFDVKLVGIHMYEPFVVKSITPSHMNLSGLAITFKS